MATNPLDLLHFEPRNLAFEPDSALEGSAKLPERQSAERTASKAGSSKAPKEDAGPDDGVVNFEKDAIGSVGLILQNFARGFRGQKSISSEIQEQKARQEQLALKRMQVSMGAVGAATKLAQSAPPDKRTEVFRAALKPFEGILSKDDVDTLAQSLEADPERLRTVAELAGENRDLLVKMFSDPKEMKDFIFSKEGQAFLQKRTDDRNIPSIMRKFELIEKAAGQEGINALRDGGWTMADLRRLQKIAPDMALTESEFGTLSRREDIQDQLVSVGFVKPKTAAEVQETSLKEEAKGKTVTLSDAEKQGLGLPANILAQRKPNGDIIVRRDPNPKKVEQGKPGEFDKLAVENRKQLSAIKNIARRGRELINRVNKEGGDILGASGFLSQISAGLKAQVPSIAKKFGLSINVEAFDWPTLVDDSPNARILKSAILDLAIMKAQAIGLGTGRALSDKDVQQQINTIGGSWGDPTTFVENMREAIRGVALDYQESMRTVFKEPGFDIRRELGEENSMFFGDNSETKPQLRLPEGKRIEQVDERGKVRAYIVKDGKPVPVEE